MEYREQAKSLYKKSHRRLSSDTEASEKMRQTIMHLIRKFIQNVEFSKIFIIKEIQIIFLDTMTRTNAHLDKASRGFLELEKYFLLLHDFPWKKEYRTLKLYSGYFNTYIAVHLSQVDSLFKLLGFRELRDTRILYLAQSPPVELCIDIAFECVVAAAECDLLQSNCSIYKLSVSDALSLQDKLKTETYAAASTMAVRGRLPSREAQEAECDYITPIQGGHRLIGQGTRLSKVCVDLPYMDEDTCRVEGRSDRISDYAEGTFDEHLQASLHQLKQEKSLKTVGQGIDEWDYVRSSLPTVPAILPNPPLLLPDVIDEDEGIMDSPSDLQRTPTLMPPVVPTPAGFNRVSSRSTGPDSAYLTQTNSSIHYPPTADSNYLLSRSSKSPSRTSHTVLPASYAGSLKRDSALLERSSQTAVPFSVTAFPPSVIDRDSSVIVRDKISPVYRNISSWPTPAGNPMAHHRSSILPNPAVTKELLPFSQTSVLCPMYPDLSSTATVFPEMTSLTRQPEMPRCGESRLVCQSCKQENKPTASVCICCKQYLAKNTTQTYV